MYNTFLTLGFGEIRFIRSQKKNPQLVHNGYIFNKKLTQANGHTTWRCADTIKGKCRAVCITKNNVLLVARRQHTHDPHWNRISNRPQYGAEQELDEYLEIKTTEGRFYETFLKVIDPNDENAYKMLITEEIPKDEDLTME